MKREDVKRANFPRVFMFQSCAFVLLAPCGLLILPAIGHAAPATSATAPAMSDDPGDRRIGAENARVYLEIGRSMTNRLDEIQRLAGELPLNEVQKKRASEAFAKMHEELSAIIADLGSEQRPSMKRVFEIPQHMSETMRQLEKILGPDLARRLRDRRDSTQTDARVWMMDLRHALADDLALPPERRKEVQDILAQADQRIAQLPGDRIDPRQMQPARDAMNEVFRFTREQLFKVLTPDEREKLQTRFADINRGRFPATNP